MPAEKKGIASGVLAMDRVLAGALGLAATGAVFQSLLEHHSFPVALGRSNWVLVALVAIGTVLTWFFVRSGPISSNHRAAAESPPPADLRHRQDHRRFHL
jgi:nitrate/nitrite transporter NarK